MSKNVKACLWEEISGFDYFKEYSRFVTWIEDQVLAGHAEELPARPVEYNDASERWFKHMDSETIWRLSGPGEKSNGSFSPEKDPRLISAQDVPENLADYEPLLDAPDNKFENDQEKVSDLSISVSKKLKKDLQKMKADNPTLEEGLGTEIHMIERI